MAKENLPKNITRRKDGRLYGRFTYNGEKYELYRNEKYNPRKLKKELDNLRYEVEHGIKGKQTDITVNDLLELWINEYKTNNKKGCVQTYQQVYNNIVKPNFGAKKIRDINYNHIQSFINNLREKYSLSRIKLAHVVLYSMFEIALLNNWLIKNPAQKIQFPKKEDTERRVMTKEEQETFLKFAISSGFYDVYVVSLYTGMRIGEILGLRWNDISFEKENIHVSGTLVHVRGKGRVRDLPKTQSSDRTIPMVSKVKEVLKSRRKRQLNMKLCLGEIYKEQEYVFTCESGIEFERITPHTFRHTFATRCLEHGMKPKVLQEIMGHSQFSITMDLYGHVLENEKEKEMQKLELII